MLRACHLVRAEFPELKADSGSVLIEVRVNPRGRQNAIDGVREGRLLLGVTAPPAYGQANAAVIAVLARALGVAKSNLELVRGHKSREKAIRINGLTVEEVTDRLRKSLP